MGIIKWVNNSTCVANGAAPLIAMMPAPGPRPLGDVAMWPIGLVGQGSGEVEAGGMPRACSADVPNYNPELA